MTYQFQKPTRPVRRVFIHCSASDNPAHDSAVIIDRWHREKGWAGIGYHYFIRKDGVLELGRDLEKTPAAQENNNTATIAICLHGLEKDKFTEAQFQTLRALCNQINRAYGFNVTFRGHCEVANKACPVFDYKDVLDLNNRGNMVLMRGLDTAPILTTQDDATGIEVLPTTMVTLKIGSKGGLVRDLQRSLTRLGYFTGNIDGDFGERTRAAVLAFQADNHLETDGKFGKLSREALALAKSRPVSEARAFASLSDLASAGSRIAKAAQRNVAVGAVLGGGGLVAVIDEVTGQADLMQRVFAEHGLITGGVILVAGAFVAWQSWRAGKARLEDHRTGKTA